jgi:hypothetical protein
MRTRGFVTLLLVGVLGAFAGARAHHSWPANYHVDQEITLEGVVLRYLWRNPHVFIYLEVTNEQEEIEKWEIEWANTNAMIDRGFSADSIREGDQIIVSGWPGRSAVKRMNLQELHRPADGLSYSSGRL